MKALTKLFFLAMVIAYFATPSYEQAFPHEINSGEHSEAESQELDWPRGSSSRFFRYINKPNRMTCNKYPRICHVRGSPGPDCCKKQCVNVMKDRKNCGMCGKKCKYSQLCCKGKCVNPMTNKSHCGGCLNKCKKGNSCLYGLCSYA